MGSDHFIVKLFKLLSGKYDSEATKISYSSNGPSGYVHYQSVETSFKLYYEFGSGTCVASIYIPSFENWEIETKLPVAQRDEVLNSIGRQVVKDQTTSSIALFKIEGNFLNIYA